MKHTLKHPLFQYGLIALMLVVPVLNFVEIEHLWFRKLNNYAVHWMFTFLGVAMLFLLFKNERLMFGALLCSALLAFNLRANSNLELARSSMNLTKDIYSIAHVKVADLNNNFEGSMNKIIQTNADLICMQGITPFWEKVATSLLQDKYPFTQSFAESNGHGLAVFSKNRLSNTDTFMMHNFVNLRSNIQINENEPPISIIFTQLTSLEDNDKSSYLNLELKQLETIVNETKGPLFTLGSFSMADWSNELTAFRLNTNLANSSKGYIPSVLSSFYSALNVPTDHIFFSPEINCITFKNIRFNSAQIGILGIYQLDDISDYVGS